MNDKSLLVGVFTLTTGFGLGCCDGMAQKWWIEAGPVVRGGMEVKVSGSSYSQLQGLHAASGPLTDPAGIGSVDGYADRLYGDGYVKLDAGTLNSAAVGGPGNTWNWAYDNAAQYTAPDARLAYHSTGLPGYTTTQDTAGGWGDKGNLTGAGVHLAGGFLFSQSGKWTFGLGLSFQGVWGAEDDLTTTTYQEQVGQVQVTDSYNVAGAVHPTLGFPPPRGEPGGYVGTYGGPSDGPSAWAGGYPVFSNRPTSRNRQQTPLATAYNEIRLDVDSDVYELGLSPRIRYTVSRKLALNLMPRLGVAYLEASADRSEVFVRQDVGGGSQTLESWEDSGSDSGFRFSAGITLGVDYELGKDFYLGAFGGYVWTIDSLEFDVGPNRVSFDASGYNAGIVFGKRL